MNTKIALITGATSGIGAAFARAYAARGYNLILTGRRKEVIDQVAGKLREDYRIQVRVILVELGLEAGIQELTSQIKDLPIDVLVNNAGFGVSGVFQNADALKLEQLVKVNVLAPIQLIQTVLPGMLARGDGDIINISSESVYLIIPGNAAYSGVKAFLKTFTEGLYLDLLGTGVRVMAVCPGLTHTDFHEKLGMDKSRQINHGPIKWMHADEVVRLALSDLEKGTVVSLPGYENKLLSIGMNMLPRPLYYRLMDRFSRKNFRD